uniref:Uncharacterized protein n=1 Tax=viral metagenome TaxID=1070528 RepID=A0A6C0F5T0_9ZZZZ
MLSNGGHHLSIIRRSNINILDNIASGVNAARLLARSLVLSITREIRVIRLKAQSTILLNPLKCVVHQTAIATLVKSTIAEDIAIDQLLFGKRYQFAILDIIRTLESSSGRETPAASALTLVLDRRNAPSINPIHRRRNRNIQPLSRPKALGLLKFGRISKEHLVIGTIHSGELIVTKNVRVVINRIVCLNELVIVSPFIKHAQIRIAIRNMNLILI